MNTTARTRGDADVYSVVVEVEAPGRGEEAVEEFVTATAIENGDEDGFHATLNVAAHGRFDAARRAANLAMALLSTGAFDSATARPLTVTDDEGNTIRYHEGKDYPPRYMVPEEVPEDLGTLMDAMAEKVVGYALDNAGDMQGVEPAEHLATEWPGYVEVVMDELDELTHDREHPVVEQYGMATLRDLLYTRLPDDVDYHTPDWVTVANPRNEG
jgi:hypothetical protein